MKRIFIEDGSFHLFTDSAGYSNKYLLQVKSKNEGEKKSSSHAVEINDISIKNFEVIIEDHKANKEISMLVNELDASINGDGKVMDIKMKEKITMKKGLGFNLTNGAYLEKQTVEARWKIQIDKETQTLSFGKTKVKINDHPFTLNGKFVFDKAEPNFAIYLDTKNLPYENVNKIVTAAIKLKTGLVQMKGTVDAQGSVIGSLLPAHEPAVDINWQTTNNTFITPVITFTECSFSGNFMNSVNKDSLHLDPNSRISFSTFQGNWDGVNLSGKNISITNLLEPQLRFVLHSDCKLEALENKFALKDISFKGGEASLDLFYDGPLTKDNSMLQDLEGKLLMRNGVIEYVPRSFTFTDCNGDVGFFKDSISMRKFSCSYLKNKLNIEVDGKNIRRKFVVNDLSQQAVVNCFVNSPYINLQDFNPLFAPVKQRTKTLKAAPTFAATARKIDEVLVNSIIAVQIKAEAVKHQKLEATNFEADIKFHPHHWEVARVSVNLAGGRIVTNGKILHGENSKHTADISTVISNVDVKKLLYAFDNFGQDAITEKNLRGNFSTTASLKAGINNLGRMIPSSLFGTLDFSLKNGAIVNFPPFENMKSFVFKNRDMKNVMFAELKNRMDIKGTDIFINRMEIQSSVGRLFVEGNYGLNGKNTDMLIQVPLSNLSNKSFTDDEAPKNKGTKAKVGMSVWIRAENDETGKVKMKLTLRKKLKDKKMNEKMEKNKVAKKEIESRQNILK
ncbi:MAG: AsmA-like C-terminal region-containing protein [Bacteroidota bacterium]